MIHGLHVFYYVHIFYYVHTAHINSRGMSPSRRRRACRCDVCESSFAQGGALARHKRGHAGQATFTCAPRARARVERCVRSCRTYYAECVRVCVAYGAPLFMGVRACIRVARPMPWFVLAGYCVSAAQRPTIWSFFGRPRRFMHCSHAAARARRCDVCNAVFDAAAALATHGRSHRGERPYKCGGCGGGFMDSGTLLRHMRTHAAAAPTAAVAAAAMIVVPPAGAS